jgi:hypothetical protein
MFVIIGIAVVFGCIAAGYLMEKGNLRVLMQPAELIIIGGAAIGTVLIANPLYILKAIAGGIGGAFGGSKYSEDKYLETMKMMYELFSRARKEGLMALETDSDAPDKSPVFSKYPKFLKDHHALDFVCDTIRMAAGGGVEPFDMDQMMELDMDVHHHGTAQPIAALSNMADALPGLGRRHHHGLAGRPSGRDWPQGGGRAGGHIPRHLALLRVGRTFGGQYEQSRRRRARLLLRSARNYGCVHARHSADRSHRIWTPRHSRKRAPRLPGC